MARRTLSDRTLKALKPADAGGRYEIFDTIIPSMGVRVTDKGKRSFFLLGRFPPSPNPTRRMLGEYPALELASARDKAREWLALLEKGIDPKKVIEEEKKAREVEEAGKASRTFETLLERYIKNRRRDGIRKADEDEADFQRDCLPTIHKPNEGKKDVKPVWEGRTVDDIKMVDILAVVEAIRDRGAQRHALNMAQKIGTFFNWCVDQEYIEVSPYRPKRVSAEIGLKNSRDRVLSDDEIHAYWKAADEVSPLEGAVYKVLMLTGQRLNDIAKMSWSEINLERQIFTVPKERFKSNRDHELPLTSDVVAILEGLKRWKNCPWVFSPNGKTPIYMSRKVKVRFDKKMLEAYRDQTGDSKAKLVRWVNHDIRRTVRTRLSELDVMDEVAELVIGHVPSKLNRTYNHSQRVRVKLEALTRWQGALNAIVAGKQPDNVLHLNEHRELA